MANTQGMSDEVVETLLGPNLSTGTASHSSSGFDTANATSTAQRRRRTLEERMEMGMGERPAARVIKASPNHQPKAKKTNHSQQEHYQQQQPPREEKEAATPPPIVGNIVERSSRQSQPQEGQTDGSNQPKKRQSRFAQQRQKLITQSGAKTTGFPSVHVPLGTFVKPKKKQNSTKNVTEASRSTANIETSAAAASRSVALGTSRESSTMNIRDDQNTASIESLQKTSSHDANAMFAQMTPEERAEEIDELQAALSPETIAFLKKRATTKKNNQYQTPQSSRSSGRDVGDQRQSDEPQLKEGKQEHEQEQQNSQTTEDKRNTKKVATEDFDGNSLEEKKRLAEILSKIRSVDDLDAAYQAEMGNYSPFSPSEQNPSGTGVNDAEEKTPFQLACDLLRSTSPRQNLWAARIVSHHLQEQWVGGKLCSVGIKDDNHFSPPWPYPVMLPASLRCLLDASISQTNGYVLHTYVLQSLYNLLRLRAHPDHVIDTEVGRKNCCKNRMVEAAMAYQEYFLEDAVPTPAPGSCYEPIANIEPINTDNNPAPGAAYKTSSSSTSAQKDGEAFAKDPMWTLLSRMCIIPRLAQLLRIASQTHQERLVPNEAIVSICGILAMIGQRSPGAASAIVHHQTLLKNLLDVSVMPRNKLNDEGEAGSQCPYDPVVAIPAIRLLCSLARQSRVAASEIPFDDVVPPLLAMDATTEDEHSLQKWSVVLWRILLR